MSFLYWDKMPFKFYATKDIEYRDTIELFQDDDGTIPYDLTGLTFVGELRYEYDQDVIKYLTFENIDATNGKFDMVLSAADIDDLNIEGYRVSLVLDVVIMSGAEAVEKIYGYLIVERG